MEDRTRRAVEKRRWTDKSEFVRQQLTDFLEGYSRCLVQQQENYVELWTEKDALSRIFERVGIPYCVTVVTCILRNNALKCHGGKKIKVGGTSIILYAIRNPNKWAAAKLDLLRKEYEVIW